MSSSGRIVNLVNPTNAQDAATRNYVETELGSSGTLTNRPTVQRGDTTNDTFYLTFINLSDRPSSDGSSKRSLLRCDNDLYYNSNNNTLYAGTFSGTATYATSAGSATSATSATYAQYAVNNTTFRIGNNVTTESSIIRDEHKGTIALFVKALSSARANRPVNLWTSSGMGADYFSPSGLGFGSNNDITTSGLTTMGGTFVAVFEGMIQVGAVIAGSDKRMKKNITEITDGTKSLQLFRAIKCSTFEYVDKFSHSPYKVHGFIAQDIKDIAPEAVHLVPDYLPNFFCMCFVEKHSIQNNDKTETFRVFIPANDTKKLIFTGNHDIKTGIEYKTASGAPASDGSGNQYFKVKFNDISDNDVEVITTRIIDDFSFLIEVPLNDKGENTVIKEDTYFLYGQLVDDFHKIDNDHIHNIATAALQEVDRQQQADKARIAELEAKVSEQQSLINDILERLKNAKI
jgi:hypothetical protein